MSRPEEAKKEPPSCSISNDICSVVRFFVLCKVKFKARQFVKVLDDRDERGEA